MAEKLNNTIEVLEFKIAELVSEISDLDKPDPKILAAAQVANGTLDKDDLVSVKEAQLRQDLDNNIRLLSQLKQLASIEANDVVKQRQIELAEAQFSFEKENKAESLKIQQEIADDQIRSQQKAANKQLAGQIISGLSGVTSAVMGGLVPSCMMSNLAHDTIKMEYQDHLIVPSSTKEFMKRIKTSK